MPNTQRDDEAADWPTPEEQRAARTLMGEHNPDEWDPEPQPDYYESGEVNLSVRGTVGPDYMGQETVNVPGHWADRPADMDPEHAMRLALRGEFDGLGDDQPLPLLRSNMRSDPIEGVQGTYAVVVELDDPCDECAQRWGSRICYTLPGETMVKCLICSAKVGGSL